MKRLQILIEEELEDAWASCRERMSKAELIRRCVRDHLKPLGPLESDPLWSIVGLVESGATDSASVDAVVYDEP